MEYLQDTHSQFLFWQCADENGLSISQDFEKDWHEFAEETLIVSSLKDFNGISQFTSLLNFEFWIE